MNPTDLPETHFARSGDVSIACQVMGNGPLDLVFVPGIVSNVELFHDFDGYDDRRRSENTKEETCRL